MLSADSGLLTEEAAVRERETDQWAFYSQLGRIFDAFTELESITPQSAVSDVDYLFPRCKTSEVVTLPLNDIVAQLLSPFVAPWMETAGLLRRNYMWDDEVLSCFSNRASIAAMTRSALKLEPARLAA
jgi:hypothetical protein